VVRPDPSRAAALALVGGDLALDFANTSSGRGSSAPQEHLRRPEHVVEWAAHAKIVGTEDAERLLRVLAADEGLATRLLDEALALREDIYDLAAALAAGQPAPDACVESLTKAHAGALALARLTPLGRNFGWSWSVEQNPVAALLGPISLSALTLLQQADLARVKQCQGDKCGWLFFDATKNKSRRWCEMEVCGNRAKQKRFGARARGA
jgi:predicted RNA-binding Zn ribbon-like protein